MSNEQQCKWCGAYLWDYGDVGPLHAKDGRSVNACELIQLRKLCDSLLQRAFHAGPFKVVEHGVGTSVAVAVVNAPNFDDIVERAKELASRRSSGQ